MVDPREFNLIYFCKTSKRRVSARMVGEREIAILDSGMVAKYSIREARKLYNGSRENHKARNKPAHVRPTISRGGGRHSQKFNEYLNEGMGKINTNF